MKLSKIQKLCKETKHIDLYDPGLKLAGITGGQWVGNGKAAYPIDALPKLDENSVYLIFGGDPDDKEKYIVKTIDQSPLARILEVPLDALEDMSIVQATVNVGGVELSGLTSADDAVLFDRRLLAPLVGEEYTLHIHRTENHTYIIAKAGMFIRAIFAPIVLHRDEDVAAVIRMAGIVTRTCQNGREGVD